MGTQELCDEKFKYALLKLTKNDITSVEKLVSKPVYCEILQEMFRRGVKMEQEMMSLFLGERRCKKQLQYLWGHAKISTGSTYPELPDFGNSIFIF